MAPATTLPRRPKEAIILIQNLSKNTVLSTETSNPDEKSTQSPFETSKKLVELYLSGKLKYASKDEVGFLAMGTKETNNVLCDDEEDSGDLSHPHIQQMQGIQKLNFSLLKKVSQFSVENIQNVARGNLLSAVDVAATMIAQHTGRKKYSRKIFIVTDSSLDPIPQEDLDNLIKKLGGDSVAVNILGVGNLFTGETQLETQLLELADATGGAAVSSSDAIELLSDLRNKAISPTTTFRGSLEIGDHISAVPMWVFKMTERASLPSAKKLSGVTDLSNKENTGAVVPDRVYHPLDNPDAILEKEDLIKGYTYGKNIVPMSTIDEEQLKYRAPKSFKLLGFADERSIPRHHYMGETYVCIPPYGDENASLGFSTLIRGMAELGRVAIVRFQSRDNCQPKLAFLYPYFKKNYDCLYLNSLPFYEDLRQYPFRSFNNITHSDAQLDAMDKLIDDMDLCPESDEMVDEGEKQKSAEELKPKHTFDPCLHYFYQCMHERALHGAEKLPAMSDTIKEQCLPEEIDHSLTHKIQERIKDKSEQAKKLFELQPVEEKATKKRKYWFALGEGSASLASLESNNTEAEAALAAAGGQQVKRLKTSDDMSSDFPSLGGNDEQMDLAARTSLFSHLAESVGTSDPVKDFKEMISRTDRDYTSKAVSQMSEVILKLLKASIGDQFFDKTLNSLRAFREGCIKERESTEFNRFLHELKSFLLENNTKFWDIMQSEQIGLISQDEAADSEVNPEQAKQFFTDTNSNTTVSQPAELTQDEEGLFDDLE